MRLVRLFILIMVLGCIVGCNASRPRTEGKPGNRPERIVSLAPSITETLFALGLGEKVVGVTRFCTYPPEAQKRKIVGGYTDPNIEVIVALSPDLVIVPWETRDNAERLKELGLNVRLVDPWSVKGVLDSIAETGKACGAEERAEALVQEMSSRIDRVRQKTAGLPKPRVLLSIGRDTRSGRIGEVFLSGPKSFHGSLLTIADGTNAYEKDRPNAPVVTAEGITKMNPDVIIDLVPDMYADDRQSEELRRQWDSLSGVDAVRNRRVYVLTGDHVGIPGPRFVRLLEDMAKAVHPEVDWEKP